MQHTALSRSIRSLALRLLLALSVLGALVGTGMRGQAMPVVAGAAPDPSSSSVVPPAFQWHRFNGTEYDMDGGSGIATDSSGNIFICGTVSNLFMGDAGQNPKHAYSGGDEIVVLKLDSNGNYLWHTFFGSNAGDYSKGIAVDASGNVYVTGFSEKGWLVNATSPKHAFTIGSQQSLFVLKLDTNGVYQWHTFYGTGPQWYGTAGQAITLDATHNAIYVGAESYVSWLGDSSTAPLNAHTSLSGQSDMTVLKLDTAGVYQWHTFLGSDYDDGLTGIVYDPYNDAVYASGNVVTTWKGPGNVSPKHDVSGNIDTAVVKLSPAGAYQWHTFWGGTAEDRTYAITTDATGSVYVSGRSAGSWGTPGHPYAGGADALAFKLSSAGALTWNTFFGSLAGDEMGIDLRVDSANSTISIAVYSGGGWNGPFFGTPVHAYSGENDIAVLNLTTAGEYNWHTFFGSSGEDQPQALALDASGNVILSGVSYASWQSGSGTSPIHAFGIYRDITALKLNKNGLYRWHTFYGSVYNDFGNVVASDGAGNVYVAGQATGVWLGDGSQAALHANSHPGSDEVVVTKLNGAGGYLWHTYYGGNADDVPYAMAVDSSDNVYVTGVSYSTWNGPDNAAPKHAFTGSESNIFILKLNKDGSYAWHTFYGAGENMSLAIAISGNTLVVGGGSSATWNGDGNAAPVHEFTAASLDLTVIKLTTDGGYLWHTFFGATGYAQVRGLGIDADGNIYAAGGANALWLGKDNALPRHGFGGNYEIFELKLDTNGAYLWHTFFGSVTDYDFAFNMAVDGSGRAYILARSDTTWQGYNNASPLHAHSGDGDITVLCLNQQGVYQWHTFYGTSDLDTATGIALDGRGGVLVGGTARSDWSGPSGEAALHAFSGGSDAVVLRLKTDGTYSWHTFYGGAGNDVGYGLAATKTGEVYVTGSSDASWNGDGGKAPLTPYRNGFDLTVFKLTQFKNIFVPAVRR